MRIAVIGSGIAGLASAARLSRAGHDVTIFERFETPRPLGAGLLLQPSGLAALDALELRSQAEQRGARVSRLIGRTPAGRPVLDLRYADGRPGDVGIGIHRATLFTLLYDAARAAGADWRAGAEIAEIQDMEAAPRLVLESGETTSPFDLAIVSDGAHSSLRHAVCPRAREHLYPWGAMWAILPDPGGARDGELAQVYRGCAKMIGLLPVGDNPADPQARPGVSFFWSLKTADMAAWRAAGLDAFKAEVSALWPRAGEAIADIEDPDVFAQARYRDGVCPSWRRGRTLLVGDAAHAMSPQLGQGANLALCDAMALCEAMEDNATIQHALPAFERARKPATRYYTLMSRALTPIFQSSSTIIGAIRDVLFPIGCRLPLIRGWMAWTLAGRGRTPW